MFWIIIIMILTIIIHFVRANKFFRIGFFSIIWVEANKFKICSHHHDQLGICIGGADEGPVRCLLRFGLTKVLRKKKIALFWKDILLRSRSELRRLCPLDLGRKKNRHSVSLTRVLSNPFKQLLPYFKLVFICLFDKNPFLIISFMSSVQGVAE